MPYWHWTVSGGKFSDGTTSQILPRIINSNFIRPDWPNTACYLYIRPVSECGVEDFYEPFKYIMINTNFSCGGYYAVSPNPADENLNVEPADETVAQNPQPITKNLESKNEKIQSIHAISKIQLINASGAVVFDRNYGSQNSIANINVSSITNGVYILRIFTKEGIEQHKIIIQHR